MFSIFIIVIGFNMKIKHLLRLVNKKKQELADFAGITTNTIRTYEKGTHQPHLDTCVKMAEFLNCSLETLAGWNTENVIDKKMLSKEKQPAFGVYVVLYLHLYM